MKALYMDRLSVLNRALDRVYGRNVRVEEHFGKFKAHWGSSNCGGANFYEATKHIESVRAATDIAEALNRQVSALVFEDDPEIWADDRENGFEECVSCIVKLLKECKYRLIEQWILDGASKKGEKQWEEQSES